MFCGRKAKPGYYYKSAAKLISAGAVSLGIIETLNGDEKFYRQVLVPIVHRMVDPESAHRLGIFCAKWKILPFRAAHKVEHEDRLSTNCFGIQFPNAVGLAAGFDKDAEAIDGLARTGLGFIEIGSVTPLPQPGNDKPRVFRLREDNAVINRYGFNSAGHEVVLNRLKLRSDKSGSSSTFMLGVNLGKNKTSEDPDQDFASGYVRFAPYADYIVVNVSSPNTPGLRDMQTSQALSKLLKRINDAKSETKLARKPALLVKVAPDLNDAEKRGIAEVCMDKTSGVDGLIISNTTTSRPEDLKASLKVESGGLSGKPLRHLSTQCVKDFRLLTKGQLPIIACGGVSSGEEAYEKIRAGANLIQLYTAIVYQGFPVISRVKRELAQCLQKDGFINVSQAVGLDCPIV